MKKFMTARLILTLLVAVACEKEGLIGTFKDHRDGHQYQMVQIGEQVWMAENLAYLPSVSPSNLGSYSDAFYYVNGYMGISVTEAEKQANYTTYGVLYNWVAATTACPDGWHLPSDEEWKVLERHLGMEDPSVDSIWCRDSGSVGSSLKTNDTLYWLAVDHGKYKHCDFEARGSGGRGVMSGKDIDYGGWFYGQKEATYFWAITVTNPLFAWYRGLWYQNVGIYRCEALRNYGFSVRCVKDE